MTVPTLRRGLAAIGLATAFVLSTGAAQARADRVVVPRGQAVQIAVVLDKSDAIGSFSSDIRNAIQVAVELYPTIRGYPIQLNDGFDAPCVTADAVARDADVAASVVANPQNVAVIGHECSFAFSGLEPPDASGCPSAPPGSALSIYERSGIVTINGSTTNRCLSTVGPTVFNSTAPHDPDFDPWFSQVKTLPSYTLWQWAYQFRFGAAPNDFAALYFDATTLLLSKLRQASRIVDGNLVIDRGRLARAVRHAARFPGVTCTVTLDPATGFRVVDAEALARCAGDAATEEAAGERR